MTVHNIRFEVTQNDIDSACKKDKKGCMIALALKRKLTAMKIDYAHTVEVDLASLRFTDLVNKTRYTFLQTPFGQAQLARFDRGDIIKPFEIKVSRPITGPMRKDRKEYKKPVEADMEKQRTGRPTLHGVKRMPPRSTPATLHSSQRSYGSNSLEKFWGEPNLIRPQN